MTTITRIEVLRTKQARCIRKQKGILNGFRR